MNTQPLHDLYEDFCKTNDLPTGLSADELICDLPESIYKEHHERWLEAFIEIWDLTPE